MPLSNKSNKSNKSSQSSSVGASEAALSAALATTHDGIVGSDSLDSSQLKHKKPGIHNVNAAGANGGIAGLMALDPEWRSAVLQGLILENLSVYQPDQKAIVGFRGTNGLNKLVSIRPPEEEDFLDQLALVRGYADLRDERLNEIDVQMSALLPFFAAIDRLDPRRCPYTLELLDIAQMLATVIVQRVKFFLNCPRPIDFSSQIQPIIPTPTHATLPSGHATEAFITAALLSHLIDGAVAGDVLDSPSAAIRQRYRLAARIATNRTVAGVHFPVDSAAGAVLGTALAGWIAGAAGDGPTRTWSFDGSKFAGDFHYGTFRSLVLQQDAGKVAASKPAEHAPEILPLLEALWTRARAEWAR